MPNSLDRRPRFRRGLCAVLGGNAAGKVVVGLPLLAPVGLVVVMIRIIESVKLFDIIYILTGGGPGTATQNVSLLDYRLGFTFLQTSKAAALGVVICIALIPMYRLWKRANAS